MDSLEEDHHHARIISPQSFLFATDKPFNSSDQWNLSQLLNFRLLVCFSLLVLLYIAFLLILPGVREKRFVSFITVTLQLLIGSLLIGALILPYWKVGEVTIDLQFQSHSKQKNQARLGVWVGLRSLNITLKHLRLSNRSLDAAHPAKGVRGMYLNERFDLGDVSTMASELQGAYADGLPYPILRVLEYFSLSQGAFAWGHQFRNAGHYTNAFLWTSFAAWLLQGLLLAVVPHHYSKTGIICGVFALISNILYVRLAPSDLNAPFPTPSGSTSILQLHYGVCFYMSVVAGSLSIFFGLVLSLLQFLRLYTLTTFLNANMDDTVGVKCRYGGRPRPMKDSSTYGGVEASNMSSSVSSSSNTASSSISTTSGSFSFLALGKPSSKIATDQLGTTHPVSRISPTLSTASIISSNPNKNTKSLDLLRKRALEKSSVSVCSIESEEPCRMTDDEQDHRQNCREMNELQQISPTCRIVSHPPEMKMSSDLPTP